jgi:hypothetical protein
MSNTQNLQAVPAAKWQNSLTICFNASLTLSVVDALNCATFGVAECGLS